MSYTRTSEVLLKIDHVNVSYGSNVVLRDVNAEITHLTFEGQPVMGQVICFLGPSGIGKTQLSRTIAGLQAPTTGRVVLKDGVVSKRGSVCMVPQNYPMFEYATVAENLKIAGKQAGLDTKAINVKATGYIETFGLKEHLTKYPKELSGGTKQRVAIARQLMCASNYIVMDEPFSGLDPISKRAAMDAILALSSLDTYNTIIIVTHDLISGMAVADTVWLMGLERNADGSIIPGARLVDTYDLASMDFAWHPGIEADSKFQDLVHEVGERFATLK